MSIPVSNFSGAALYLDTMVFHALLRTRDSVVETMFQRIENGEVQAYTSALSFDELAYRMLLALIKDKYGGSPLEMLRSHQAEMISEFYPRLEPTFAQLYRFPHLFVQEVAASDLVAMQSNILQHHLLPRDALHLAAMQKCQCFQLVSNDSDYDSIPFIQRYTLT